MIETRFKKTEVGVIPEDWVVKPIGEIADIVTGSTPSTLHPEYYGMDFMFVSPFDLGEHKFVESTNKMLSLLGFSITRQIPAGSILYTCTGSTIGKLGIASDTLATNQQINAILPNEHYNSDYLFYAIQTRKDDIRKRASVQAVPLINKNNFSKTLIAFPPEITNEQCRIANTLSDIDALISDLEALIEKKQNIKQGVMQALLSGKRRLTGFTGEWKKKPFFEVLYSCNNKSKQIEQNQYLESGITPIVDQGKQLIGGYTDKADPIKKETGPYIVFGDHTCFFKYVDFDFYLGADGTQLLKCYKDYNTAYINYACQMIALPNTGYDRHFKYLRDAVFFLPSLKAEQNSIAKVLMTMDSEINALQARLDKYKQLKQGMMQQLLTGRIRLK